MKPHWFFTNSVDLIIWTYGLGNHPSATYKFDNRKDFDKKVKQLKSDNYEFIKDQPKSS
jgi:hypothetical protein